LATNQIRSVDNAALIATWRIQNSSSVMICQGHCFRVPLTGDLYVSYRRLIRIRSHLPKTRNHYSPCLPSGASTCMNTRVRSSVGSPQGEFSKHRTPIHRQPKPEQSLRASKKGFASSAIERQVDENNPQAAVAGGRVFAKRTQEGPGRGPARSRKTGMSALPRLRSAFRRL